MLATRVDTLSHKAFFGMPADTNDMIAAIYAATLSPNDFHNVFDTLDSVLFLDGDQDAAASPLTDAAVSHIDMARSIQERIGRSRSTDQKLETIVESVPNPAYIVSQSETVVAANAMAHERYGRMPALLKQLVAVDDVLQRVRTHLKKNEAGAPLAVAGQAEPGRKTQTSVLLSRIDPSIYEGKEKLFLLSIVDFGFDERVTALFRDAYGLTQAESHVAVLLASGLTPADIAIERRVSVETIRTQIKIIKSKTSVRDLPGLVRLLCGFTASLLGQARSSNGEDRWSPLEPLRARRRIALRDGRRLAYLEQGAADGRPVLLFHNLPYGAELPAAAIRQAHADGLRIIAPFRPGMAGTDPLPKTGLEEHLTGSAADCLELMDTLGIRSAVALGHSVGSTFAFRFARLHPDRISRIVAVSRAPAWKPDWIADLPQRQRFVVRLAKHFPQVLPVVAWAMIACLESSYATEFVRHGCKDGPADARAAEDQETVDLIAQGSVEALRNSVAAFCLESLIVQMDFTDEARDARHKFHILHGADDHIIPLPHSRAFADAVPGTRLDVVEGAGQLLFFSHWRHMLDAVMYGPSPPARASAFREMAGSTSG